MTSPGWLGLASRSPRRIRLLRESGFDATVIETEVDDSKLRVNMSSPSAAATALAWFKAAAGIAQAPLECRVVLGADTFVVKNDRIIGKPADASDARRIVRRLSGGEHAVLTGVAIAVRRATNEPHRRLLFCDTANVRVGAIKDRDIDHYIESGDWRGKAGAYNFAERVAAGWPLTCDGDPTTVMGLPMRRLAPILTRLQESADTLRETAYE